VIPLFEFLETLARRFTHSLFPLVEIDRVLKGKLSERCSAQQEHYLIFTDTTTKKPPTEIRRKRRDSPNYFLVFFGDTR